MKTAYWWRNDRLCPRGNFGDLLTPLLLQHFAGQNVRWAPIDEASIVGVGSILEHIPPMWNGIIAGAGKLAPWSELRLYSNRANILALRGPLSALGIAGDYAIGDPGLLANELVTIQEKKYDLGIVPHWSDKALVNDPRWTPFHPKIIRPDQDPLVAIRAIGECRKIVASSLHGLIIADAFGIPRRFEYTPTLDKDGGKFKFEDYHASVNMKVEIGKLQTAHRYTVEDRQHELYDVYESLRNF